MFKFILNWIYENTIIYQENLFTIKKLGKEIIKIKNEMEKLKEKKDKEIEQLKAKNDSDIKNLKEDNEDHVKRYKYLIEEKNTVFAENIDFQNNIKKL